MKDLKKINNVVLFLKSVFKERKCESKVLMVLTIALLCIVKVSIFLMSIILLKNSLNLWRIMKNYFHFMFCFYNFLAIICENEACIIKINYIFPLDFL